MRFLTLFILIAVVSCQNPSSTGDTSANGADTVKTSPYVFTDTILVSIYPKDFVAVLKEKTNLPIIDLRTPKEFATAHIWRSTNINSMEPNFMDQIARLGRDQEYAVYCQFGEISFKVAEDMKRLGFKRIYHLKTGLNNWNESGQALQLK
jgi:rhodanese-related sulfurtransferase